MISKTSETIAFRRLGRTDISVSELGIGCWAIGGPDTNLGMPMGWAELDEGAALLGLETAFSLGVNLFDTADIYGHGRSERLLGNLVRQVEREDLVLTSKVGYFSGTAAHGYQPGHLRHQLEQSLENLNTSYLDVYFFHHLNFGPNDRFLDEALSTMQAFVHEGLVRSIGMRGPHRFALDRLQTDPALRDDKIARFYALFERIKPHVLAVRDNLLTPAERSAGIFALADSYDCGVLVNKPLGQGLLTGTYGGGSSRTFAAGDHRSRKRWFGPEAAEVIGRGIDRLRQLVGPDPQDLVRVAVWACLVRSPRVAVLTGFTSPEQVRMNVTCLREQPDDSMITAAREIMAGVQRELDASGEVFADELLSPRPPS